MFLYCPKLTYAFILYARIPTQDGKLYLKREKLSRLQRTCGMQILLKCV